jgi:hypothetical protein
MNRKIIIFGLLAILIIGGGLFFFLTRSNAPSTQTNTQNGNPFGQTSGGNVSGNTNSGGGTSGNTIQLTNTQNDNGAVIEKIVSDPVAGFAFIGSGSTTIIRYAERGTGKVNDIDLRNPSNIYQKVSADTQTRIISAYFINQGKDLIRFRENDGGTIDALYSSLSASTTAPSKLIAGTILSFSPNISDNKGVFVVENGAGSVISIANTDSSNAKKIWSSSLQDITAQGLNKDVLAVQDKPAKGLYGMTFLVSNSVPQFYLDGQSGFKANLSADSNWAVFSDYSNTNSPISIFDKILNKSWGLFIPTVPEKCLWSNLHTEIVYCFEYKGQFSNLPDDWYLGKVFLDTAKLWKISAKTQQDTVIADFSSLQDNIDVIKPSLSPDEKTFVFINKRDNSLWAVDLSKVKPSF